MSHRAGMDALEKRPPIRNSLAIKPIDISINLSWFPHEREGEKGELHNAALPTINSTQTDPDLNTFAPTTKSETKPHYPSRYKNFNCQHQ
jgi:hypothetical protein